jgi:hypothetical protein
MSLLQEAAHAVAQAAGWKTPHRDGNGAYQFQLEGDLNMEFFSPEGRTGILHSMLKPLPETDAEADALLQKCAQRAVACCKTRKSILSVDQAGLHLHRSFRLDELSPDMLRRTAPTEARDFLNDLAWWKNQIMSADQASSSPFSFSWPGGRPPGR